jgi:predicted PurR-regulated permease PerM
MDMADSSRAASHVRRVRSRAVDVLAAVALVALLKWGQAFFVPLLLSVLLSLALSPLVDVLERFVRWRVVAAFIVVGACLSALGVGVYMWSDQASEMWDKVPRTVHTVADSLTRVARKPAAPITEVKKAAAEIESAAQGSAAPPSPAAAAANANATATTSLWQMVWTGGKSVGVVLSQVVSVIFLVFFMLSSGTLFKRKIVIMSGERLTQRKLTVEMLDEIDAQVRRYLMVLIIANTLVGIGTFAVFRTAGLEYAGLWGLIAAVLHTIPYFGPALIAAASLIVAFVQFGDWGRAAVVAGSSVLVAALVGQVFATWLASRQTRMNTTATFIGLLFFAWLWGFWGLLLGIPLLALVKTVCDHNEDWKPIAELLGQ